MAADFELHIKGKKISMNEFVSNVIHDVTKAMMQHLHGVELDKISKIEIS